MRGDIEALSLRAAELEIAQQRQREMTRPPLVVEAIVDNGMRELAERLSATELARDALEQDAKKLADGVKVLVTEREDNKLRADAAEARVVELDKRVRAAHAALEEARREVASSREGISEIAGQRDTLKQVVTARERQLQSTKEDLLRANTEMQRLREQSEMQQKSLAEARQRLSGHEVDRAQSRRRESTEASPSVDVSRIEGELAMERHARDQDRARIALLEATLDEAQRALEKESACTEVQRAALAEARGVLAIARTRGDLLRDQLTETGSILDQERARAALFQEDLKEARSRLDSEHSRGDLFYEELVEARSRLDGERARGDLFAANLNDAQQALGVERARADLFEAELFDARVTFARRAIERADAVQASTSSQRVENAGQSVDEGKRIAELRAQLDAEVKALRDRLDASEKAAVQKDAKISEQADRITRLTERLVREAGIA